MRLSNVQHPTHFRKNLQIFLISNLIYAGGLEAFVKVTSWPSSNFTAPENATHLDITGSVVNVPSNMFSEASWIQHLSFGNSVQAIGSNAFKGCSNLQDVFFGKSVKTIGQNAFAYCRVRKLRFWLLKNGKKPKKTRQSIGSIEGRNFEEINRIIPANKNRQKAYKIRATGAHRLLKLAA